ncbi:MAG: hypothetical protein ACREGI_00960, partial [Candidatus Levyibacteriota bacterium]
MKLPFSSFFNKKVTSEYFLALLMRDEKISAVVFEEKEGSMLLIGKGEETFEEALEELQFEKLLDVVDKAISTAESVLPNNIQTHKTVFGVKESWITDGKINHEHLVDLKKLSDELDLTPIGFLVFSEAIAHLLQKEEGAPISAILVDCGKKYATVSLIRSGRVVGTKNALIEDSLVQTVDTLLKHFDEVEILPSRIILFNGEATRDKTQGFINHHWSKALPFLHLPQIATLEDGADAKAILFGTATQMGFDATAVTQVPVEEPLVKQREEKQVKHVEKVEEPEERIEKEEEQFEEKSQEETPIEAIDDTVSQDFFGFAKEKDVAKEMPKKKEIPVSHVEHASDNFAVIPEEVKEEETHEDKGENTLPVEANILTRGIRQVTTIIGKNIPQGRKIITMFFSFLQGLGEKIKGRQATASSLPTGPKRKIFFIIPLIFAVLILCFVGYIFILKASVAIIVNPKTIDSSKSVTFSTDKPSDFSQNIIAGQTIDTSEDGSLTEATTGTKEIGNKATGTVTVFNSDNNSQTLSSGTTLTADGGLKFVTTQSITVASASGDIFSGTKPGTTDVPVSASD